MAKEMEVLSCDRRIALHIWALMETGFASLRKIRLWQYRHL